MRLMDTAEGPTNPVGELISTEQPLGLNYLAFAMNPLGFYRVEPRALGGQQTRHYPHSGFASAVFDLAVVGGNPLPDLVALMPGGVVPDKKQGLLAPPLELLTAPREKLCSYSAHGAAIDEPQPGLLEFRQIHPVAGESLRLRVVLSRFLLQKTHWLCGIRPRVQARPLKAREPGLVLEAQSPLRMGFGEPYQSISSPFLRAYSGSGLSIQRLARSQRTPSLASVARMVSPVVRLSVMPSSKLTSAAIASVQKVLSLPNLLGCWWSISRRASASPSSKAAWTSLGREEPGVKAARPRSLKSWMALRAVWEPHPRFSAIRGARSRRALTKRIWQRRRMKASEERNPLSRALRSFFESVRTKIGGFMGTTVTHHSQPVLKMH